jgi:transcription initiation factor TFIID subunit 5
MSAATPAASGSPDGTTLSNTDVPQNASSMDRTVLEYLRVRGYHAAEQSLLQDLDVSPSPTDKGKAKETSVSVNDFAKHLAGFIEAKTGDDPSKGSASTSGSFQNLVATIGAVGAEEILSIDPTDKQEGYRELEAWVDGSLDMYRVGLLFRTMIRL